MRGSGPFPADLDEQALAEGLARRDQATICRFLEQTHRPVYLMTARLTHDPDLRHDWTHDVLLKVVDELGRGRFVYRWPGCFWSWFQKRSYFLLINQYRRHRLQDGRWTIGEVGEEIVERMALPEGSDPTRLMEDVEARRIVEECLDKLHSDDHRESLHLLLFEQQSYLEIAERLGTALNTVRSWIRRARAAVRECVVERYGIEADDDG